MAAFANLKTNLCKSTSVLVSDYKRLLKQITRIIKKKNQPQEVMSGPVKPVFSSPTGLNAETVGIFFYLFMMPKFCFGKTITILISIERKLYNPLFSLTANFNVY